MLKLGRSDSGRSPSSPITAWPQSSKLMALLFRLLGERGKLIAVLLISAAVIDNPCHFATPTQSCQEFQLVAGRDRYKDRDAALTPAAFLHRFREDRLLRGSCTPLFDTQLFFIF